LYPQPLSSNIELIKVTDMSRLTMAIMYLQVDRIIELLEEEEILNNLSEYYFGYEGYKQTPIIALCTGNFPNNASIYFGDNMYKYVEILGLLINTQKINIDAVDVFNKTAKDYINELRGLPKEFINIAMIIYL